MISRREKLVVLVVAIGVYATLTTELLSLGASNDLNAEPTGSLTRGWLLAVWLPLLVAGIWLAIARRSSIAVVWADCRRLWSGAGLLERICVVAIAVIVAILGLIALVAAPNNWDSMTYHLIRVEQWVQLQGIAHYATIYEPQIYHPPGAEIFIAIGRVLSGGDRFAGLVQWGALVVCIPVASLAARQLGAAGRGQVLAALLVVTTPMAIMQATSTQNDLVVALWLLIAATLTISIAADGGHVTVRALAAAAALGLAVLTKGTGLMFALPVAALLIWAVVKSVGWKSTVKLAAAGLLIVVLINAAQWTRNLETFGTPVATGSGDEQYQNVGISPATVISNTVRNTTNHLDTPIGAVNRGIVTVVDEGLGLLGIDANDPRNTFGTTPFEVGPFGPHEDHAGSPVQVLLLLFVFGALLLRASMRSSPRVAWALTIIGQILLFVTLIKWQNWHARLHLPTIILAAPLIAACVAEVRKRWFVPSVVTVLLLMAPLYVFYNYTRPLVGNRSVLTAERAQQYFAAKPPLKSTYLPAIEEIERRGIKKLAVVGPIDIGEYPFYALNETDGFVLFDAEVSNETGKYPNKLADADAVVCITCFPVQRQIVEAAGFEQVPVAQIPVDFDPRLGGGTVSVELWVRR